MSTSRLGISMLALLILTTTTDAKDFMPWLENLAEAQRIAASRNQLVMVHFTADWCGPCQRLKKNIYSQRSFGHAVGQDFVPVRIDVGTQPQIAKQYSVAAWPTDLILTPNGQELHRMVCPQTETEYLAILRQIAWRNKTTPNGRVAQSSLPPMGNSRPSSSVTAPVANFLNNKLGRPNAAAAPIVAAESNGYQRHYGGISQPMQKQLTGQQQVHGTGQPQITASRQLTAQQPMTPQQQLAAQQRTTPQQQFAAQPQFPRPQETAGQNAAQRIPSAVAMRQQGLQQAQFAQLQPPQTSAVAGTAGPSAPVATSDQPAFTSDDDAAKTAVRLSTPSSRMYAPTRVVAGDIPNPGYVENPMAAFDQSAARVAGSISHAQPAAQIAAQIAAPTAGAGSQTAALRPSAKPVTGAEPDPAIVAAYAKALEAARKRAESTFVEPETVYNEFVNESLPSKSPQRAVTTTKAERAGAGSNERARPKIHMPTPAATAPKHTRQDPKAEAIANSSPPANEPSVRQVSVAPSQLPVTTPTSKEKKRVQVAMDGFCPVSLLENNAWVRGDRQWGARHRGCVYLFNSAAAQQQFLADPDRYSPMLAGYDPVSFVEQQRYVTGTRKHGIRFQDHIVLFSSEDSLEAFSANPDRYVDEVQQVMRSAARR